MWRDHLNQFRLSHPTFTLKQAMQEASKTYKGSGLRQSRVVRFDDVKIKKPKAKPKSQNLNELTSNLGIHRYKLEDLKKYYSPKSSKQSGRGFGDLFKRNGVKEIKQHDSNSFHDPIFYSNKVGKLTGEKPRKKPPPPKSFNENEEDAYLGMPVTKKAIKYIPKPPRIPYPYKYKTSLFQKARERKAK